MINIKSTVCLLFVFMAISSCNHPKPKPISADDTKMTVAVNGKKDSVVNNQQKNYGNATVSEPCVKCLIAVIQTTDSYKTLTGTASTQNIIYNVDWITSSAPKNIGSNKKIINGMQIALNNKAGGSVKRICIYLYNNENATFYVINNQNKIDTVKIADASLKKIRNSCFWGVASAK